MRKPTLPLLAALLLLGIPELTADQEVTEEWHMTYLSGSPAGYAHQVVKLIQVTYFIFIVDF